MWLVPVLPLFTLLAVPSDQLPEPITTQQTLFSIPFQLEQVQDPQRQPVEVQLHVSGDRGASWQLYSKADPRQGHFLFRAGGDGEFWFLVRTVDRSGAMRPHEPARPGLRVIVDTRPKPAAPTTPTTPTTPAPVATTPPAETPVAPPNPWQAVTPSTPTTEWPAHTAPHTPTAAVQPVAEKPTAPAVASEVHPPIRNQYVPPSDTTPAETTPAEPPRMVNARLFELEYDLGSTHPGDVASVELWGTRDGGSNWKNYTLDNDNRSPLVVNVAGEGIYGFKVVVRTITGAGYRPPTSGDQPEIVVGVDLTAPTAGGLRVTPSSEQPGRAAISWTASDSQLADRPVELCWGETPAGPWIPLAAGLENTGSYAWTIPARLPSEVYVHLKVRDEAGNVAEATTPRPIRLKSHRPKVEVSDVQPPQIRDVRTLGGSSQATKARRYYFR